MTFSGEEIQANLTKFVARWTGYAGSEKGEAQTFVNELFACYGQDRKDAGALFEDPLSEGITDLHWPEYVIIEMKAPAKAGHLDAYRAQALAYWHRSDDPRVGRAAVPNLVLCAFSKFEVWQPGLFPSAPRSVFELSELPDRYEELLFLAGDEPLFLGPRRSLTIAAARDLTQLFHALEQREAAEVGVLHAFILQIVWCLFAESLKLLPHQPVQRIVEALLKDRSRSSAAELGHLFSVLAEPLPGGRGAVYQDQPYVNGQLFDRPARVHLDPDELRLLADAALHDWQQVDPTIFGSLLEGFIGKEQRDQTGVHYTHEVDILKIVRPTIVEPWIERIAGIATIAEADAALHDLGHFRVLDPACGCGNFLYVAYRELRAIESRLRSKRDRLFLEGGIDVVPSDQPPYALSNLCGLEIDEFCVGITRVVLWMGQELAAKHYGTNETVLPLVSLSNIRQGDALFDVADWPEAQAIIGNPPFNGSQHLRAALGDEYVERLKREFGCGVKDYCVYWFRKAADSLEAGQRAGLVGTNSIAQNKARSASLDYLISHGGVITNAVSSQKWPGEAKVHVSIVNWVQRPAEPPISFLLNGNPVSGITAELRPEGTSVAQVKRLAENRGRSFQGPIPVGGGFILDAVQAADLLTRKDATYSDVVRRYLVGEDIAHDPEQSPRRWIIDFGLRTLEEAMRYPVALDVVRQRVKPERDASKDKGFRESWWRFGRPRGEMREAIGGLERYIAGVSTGKRALFTWCDASWCPSNLTNVFAFEDSYSFGVLTSTAHTAWAWAQSSTLKGDIRYTPTTVFETFPWPDPVPGALRDAIAAPARQIFELRRALCGVAQIGLTELYNRMDDGAYRELAAAHAALDRDVAAAYGWPAAIASERPELVARLVVLATEIAEGSRPYTPFKTLPGSDGALTLPL